MRLWCGSILVLLIASPDISGQEFYFGADLSYINEMEDCGAAYNVDGIASDPYQIFSQHGGNVVRLRLWHTPDWYDDLNDGKRYSDLADVSLAMMRAKDQQLDVLLNFHLSDTWADPAHQVIPAAWLPVVNNLPLLQDSLYNYIYTTLFRLGTMDLLPEFVQIGNETNRGILLTQEQNDAGWSLDWSRNIALFNTAIAAVRDIETFFSAEIKIAVHFADPSQSVWYVDQFHQHGIDDFDIIGLSYYYQWHEDVIEEVGQIISDYRMSYPGKEVMILETAYPWTSGNADAANNLLSVPYPGYSPFTPARQKQWLIDLTQMVIDHGGRGVIYWEPGWVSTSCHTQWAQGSSWDNATFFDHNHKLISAGGIGWMGHAYDFISGVHESRDADHFFASILNGQLRIQPGGENEEEVIIRISSVNGSILLEKRISNIGFHELNISHLNPGGYVVTVIGMEGGIGSAWVFKVD